MSVLQGAQSGLLAEVDRERRATASDIWTLPGVLRVTSRPGGNASYETSLYGNHRMSIVGGPVTGATMTAGAPLWTFHNTSSGLLLMLIRRVQVEAFLTTGFVTAQEFGLDLQVIRRMTGLDTGLSGSVTATYPYNSKRTSKFSPGYYSTWYATTGAGAVGTSVADSTLASVRRWEPAAAATVPRGRVSLLWDAAQHAGNHPIILRVAGATWPNDWQEGLRLTNAVAMTASGALRFVITVDWDVGFGGTTANRGHYYSGGFDEKIGA